MKSSSWTMDLLRLVFQNVSAGGIGDNEGLRGSKLPGNLYVSLHTDDPMLTLDGEPRLSMLQNSGETKFQGYRRVAVPRTQNFWDVTLAEDGIAFQVSNKTELMFPEPIGSKEERITHVGIGTEPTGPGKLLYSNALKTVRTVNAGIVLAFKPGKITVIEK